MLGQVLRVELYGATIARMDGATYASLFIGQPVVDEDAENAKGIVVMKLSCDESVYTELKSSVYPCNVDMHIRLKKAAQGKMGQHCFGLDVIPPTHSTVSRSGSGASKSTSQVAASKA